MSTDTRKQSWQKTGKRFITFLDIMGFKDLVMRTPHAEVYNKLNYLSGIRTLLDQLNGELDGYYLDSEIMTISFSDSIILISKTDTRACFDLITFASGLLFFNAIEKNIPLKGAISYGELSVNRSKQIYFGQPLIDSYILHDELKYYGIVAHHSIEKYINDNHGNLITEELYLECSTPFKSGTITHKNINWLSHHVGPASSDESEIDSIFRERMKNLKTGVSGEPRIYVDNTIKVFENVGVIRRNS